MSCTVTYAVELFTYQTNFKNDIMRHGRAVKINLYNFNSSFEQKSFFRSYFFPSHAKK